MAILNVSIIIVLMPVPESQSIFSTSKLLSSVRTNFQDMHISPVGELEIVDDGISDDEGTWSAGPDLIE